MALTPEDVVNKRFQPTKFREGYDQDEVDDFLDEVVVELRRLNQESEELRQRLIASESRIAELQRSGAAQGQPAQGQPAQGQPAQGQPAQGQYAPNQPAQGQFAQAADTAAQPQTAATPRPAAETSAVGQDVPGVDSDAGSTNNLLQLARRLHEEHVREGIEKRDAYIAEGHATAARIVGEAEAQQRQHNGVLEAERSALEAKIEELRTFEREYRQKLKRYIEGQLQELESNTPLAAGGNRVADNAASTNAASTNAASTNAAPTNAAPTNAATAPSTATLPPASYQGFGGN